MECVSCHQPAAEGLLCGGCGAVQPPRADLDKFAALGLPRRFELDVEDLELRHRELARRLHPDRFARASADERLRSLRAATALNDAYRTLRDVVLRAEYLVELGGAKANERHPVDPAFLVEILELREEHDAARAAGDEARATALVKDVRRRRDDALASLGGLFARAEAMGAGAVGQIRAVLTSVRYFARFLDEHTGGEE